MTATAPPSRAGKAEKPGTQTATPGGAHASAPKMGASSTNRPSFPAGGPSLKTKAARSEGLVTHVVGDQTAVINFLADPVSHGLDPELEQVERIDTHGAVVFLAGARAYKLKRAVCFPFMDLSTLARREEACKAEIAINRPLAPEIYIDAVAITRGGLGNLTINGQGEPIEWAVEMHRFDHTQTFDCLVRDDCLTDADLDAAIDAAVAFQNRAPERRAADWIADLGGYIEHNDQAFHEASGIFAREAVGALTVRMQAEWKRLEQLLLARGRAQRVRRCHGDLHLGNVVKLKNAVRLFDAVEFDERIATGDVLYDLAFLLMDLDKHGHRRQANQALGHFLSRPGGHIDFEGLGALPFFLSMRAALRAKISAMSAAHHSGQEAILLRKDAQSFFAYAADMLEARDVSLTVIGGLSGTGKSRLARALAPALGRAPGAIIIRSDVVRKAMMNARPNERLGEAAYQKSVTVDVYAEMARLAALALKAGHSVVMDAVFANPEERRAIEDVAHEAECHFAAVWLEAPLDTRLDRVEHRQDDASDADGRVIALQEAYQLGDMTWPVADASGSFDAVLEKVRRVIDRLN